MTFRKFLLTLGLTVCSLTTHADDVSEALKARLQSMQSVQADFTQTVVDVDGEVLQQADGRMVLMQPDRLRWEVAEPEENTLIADGKTLWHIDPFVEQVVAMSQQQAIEHNPLILLTDPDNVNWQQYNIAAQPGDNATIYLIESLQADSQFANIRLIFSGEMFTGLDLIDQQGQVSEIRLSNVRQNQAIDSEQFKFVMPDGYDLDDQRTQ